AVALGDVAASERELALVALLRPAAVDRVAPAVVAGLGALEREGLPAHREPDPQDPHDMKVRVVFESRLAPLEHLEEELAGELLDPQRQPVMRVEPRVEDQAREGAASREAPGEELVERRGGKGAAPEKMNAQPVARQRARDVDDLPVLPVDGPAVGAPADGQAAGAPVQLHPLEQVGEAEDVEAAAQLVRHPGRLYGKGLRRPLPASVCISLPKRN